MFAIFEFRFLLSVWRARRGGVDPWTAQREVSVLYLRFYAALLGGILLTYKLQRCGVMAGWACVVGRLHCHPS